MPLTRATPGNQSDHWPAAIALFALIAVPFAGAAQTAGTPSPMLAADVNDARTITVYSGWPMLFRVRFTHPQLFDTNAVPVTLAADSGNWTGLLHVEVHDASGTPVSWPLTLLNSPRQSLRLDGQHLGELYWSLSPAQTMALPAGDYTITFTWDSHSVTTPSAWKGIVSAIPLAIAVRTEPTTLTTDQLEQKQRWLAAYHLALGNAAEALVQIEVLLQADPGNIGGMTDKGAILEELGRYEEALDITQQALDTVRVRYPNADEAPRDLLAQRFELTQLLYPGRLNSVVVTNNNVTLDWNTIAGQFYSVESTPDFTNWTVIATGLLAETNRMIWSTNRLQNREFFRIGQ